MATVKRIYLYGVLGAALVPLLLGLTDLLRLIIDGLADMTGISALSARIALGELSWSLTLVVIAAPIWAFHAWLMRRWLHRPEPWPTEERASTARAAFFFVVLVATAAVAGWHLIELTLLVLRALISGDRPWGLSASLCGALVVGTAWLGHLAWRAGDFRQAAQRIAGDWLTRLYLYGVLFVLIIVALVQTADLLVTAGRVALDVRPAWEPEGWWREALASSLAVALVASTAWLVHWGISGRLVRAAGPMGEAHRASRSRTGYFLGIVLLCAGAVLTLASLGLRHVFAEVSGVWRPSDGSRLIEDVGGPVLMLVPFVAAWWWHLRRASAEAHAFGGAQRRRSVVRSGRYVVALVGLVGLAIGLAWGLQAALDLLDGGARGSATAGSIVREAVAPALAAGLVGLAMWTPAWLRIGRDRTRDPVESANATSRRAYLLLVCGLALVAVVGALGYLVYQAMRTVLEAGALTDTTWAISILLVGGAVLVGHLVALRADIHTSAAAEAAAQELAGTEPPVGAGLADTGPETVGAIETLELSGPAGADFEAINAAIRAGLPAGYRLSVLSVGRSG